jgi:hypothetical protein
MSFQPQKRYEYELKYQNGEYYLPGNFAGKEKSFIIEEMETSNETVRYRTSLAVQDAQGGRQNVFSLFLTEMTPGRARKYMSEYCRCRDDKKLMFKTWVLFDDGGKYRSLARKFNYHGDRVKVKSCRKNGRIKNHHFMGMFHYTFLNNRDIRDILTGLNPENAASYRDIPFNSMEIDPKSAGISYWKIVLQDIAVEYREGLDAPVRLYRLRFRAKPGLLTRLYFKVRHIVPEFCLWLTEDKERIYQIEEFSAGGNKVVYRLLS